MEFSNIKPKNILVFPLCGYYVSDLETDELGKLVTSFNSQFSPFHNLLVRMAFANDDRDKYHLYVTKGATDSYAPNQDDVSDLDKKLSLEDEKSMRGFIAGFIHGVRSFRKKKNRCSPTTRRY